MGEFWAQKNRGLGGIRRQASTAHRLSNLCATETHLAGYNLPISSTNLKLLT